MATLKVTISPQLLHEHIYIFLITILKLVGSFSTGRAKWWLGYWLKDPRFDTRQGQGTSHFSQMSRTALRPKIPSGRWVQPHLSPGMKRPDHETEHPPPTGTEIVDELSYSLLFLRVFMACTGTTVTLRPTQVWSWYKFTVTKRYILIFLHLILG